MRTTRRHFLPFLLVSSLGAFISPAFAWRGSSDACSRATLAALLATFAPDTGSAKVVGREYLRQYPAEAHAAVLLERIFLGDAHRRAEFVQANPEARRALVGQLIREDFAQGRIVHVRGWMLSHTETRLYAMTVVV
jgi:hypothetical protein